MKGLVFLGDHEIILRFALSGAFDALEAAHDVTYVARRSKDKLDGLGLESFLAAGRRAVEQISVYPERVGKWRELFNVSCVLYEDRSSSFAVRNAAVRMSTRFSSSSWTVRSAASLLLRSPISLTAHWNPRLAPDCEITAMLSMPAQNRSPSALFN